MPEHLRGLLSAASGKAQRVAIGEPKYRAIQDLRLRLGQCLLNCAPQPCVSGARTRSGLGALLHAVYPGSAGSAFCCGAPIRGSRAQGIGLARAKTYTCGSAGWGASSGLRGRRRRCAGSATWRLASHRPARREPRCVPALDPRGASTTPARRERRCMPTLRDTCAVGSGGPSKSGAHSGLWLYGFPQPPQPIESCGAHIELAAVSGI